MNAHPGHPERRAHTAHWLSAFANLASRAAGRATTFALAIFAILVWAITGPMFGFNDTWQLVINTSTTIITFLMVFLIQNTQNRDAAAVQIKLDELIRATKGAHNVLLDLEELEEHEIERLRDEYEALAADSRHELDEGKTDTEVRETKEHSQQALDEKKKSKAKRK